MPQWRVKNPLYPGIAVSDVSGKEGVVDQIFAMHEAESYQPVTLVKCAGAGI